MDAARSGLAAAGSDLRAGIDRAARTLLDLLLPVRCPACTAVVADPGLCGRCWSRVQFIAAPFCVRLGTPFPYDSGQGNSGGGDSGEGIVSPAALADPPDYDRARAVARYDGPARAIVQSLKFRDRMETAQVMAGLMARAGAQLLAECDVIVPVPLHRKRLFSRRFNQSALLAAALARLAGRDHLPDVIRRVRPTRQQVGLSARERRANVAGAFRIPPETRLMIQGRRVLIVDDVLTTGATVNACARICRKAGAASVDVLVFARVVTDA